MWIWINAKSHYLLSSEDENIKINLSFCTYFIFLHFKIFSRKNNHNIFFLKTQKISKIVHKKYFFRTEEPTPTVDRKQLNWAESGGGELATLHYVRPTTTEEKRRASNNW